MVAAAKSAQKQTVMTEWRTGRDGADASRLVCTWVHFGFGENDWEGGDIITFHRAEEL